MNGQRQTDNGRGLWPLFCWVRYARGFAACRRGSSGVEMGMRLPTVRRWRPVDNRTAPLPLAGRSLPHFSRAANLARRPAPRQALACKRRAFPRAGAAALAWKWGCGCPPSAAGGPWTTAPLPCHLRAGRSPIFRALGMRQVGRRRSPYRRCRPASAVKSWLAERGVFLRVPAWVWRLW